MEEEEENHIVIKPDSHKKKKKKKKIKEETAADEHPINMEVEEEETNNQKKVEEEELKKDSIQVKLEVINAHPEKIAPLIGYFPSGFDPHKIRNDEDDEDDEDDGLQVGVYRKKDRPNRLQLVVSPSVGSNVNFVGGSHSGEAAASQLCSYALGILDKESQTLQIVPIAANKILRLEPQVRGLDSPEKELKKEVKEENEPVSERQKTLRRLTSAYGTKGANRKDKKLADLNLKQDVETQKLINEKIDEVGVNKEALATTSGNSARNIPPHDPAADTPEKAYPLEQIILKGEWDYLLDILELLDSGTEINSDAYPKFVCNRIPKLLEIEDEEERGKLACIFSYITHLIKFKDQRSSRHDSPAKNHKIPAILHKKFLTMFAGSETYNLPVEKVDLLISYVLVLTLIADSYRTDISDIASDLKMTNFKLRDHCANLGGKLSREGVSLFCTLPVPLEFPKLRLKRRRR